MKRALLGAGVVLLSVGAAWFLFSPVDTGPDVPEARAVADEGAAGAPAVRAEHTPDGARSSSRAKPEDDGSYHDGEPGSDEPYLTPGQIEAAERRAQPFPMWNNGARSSWRVVAYELKKLGDGEHAAIAQDVYDQMMDLRKIYDTPEDLTELVDAQRAAIDTLRSSPNAAAISDALDRTEETLSSLENLPAQ